MLQDHELQRGWRLQSLPLKDDASVEEVAQESVAILLALLARGVDEYPYGDFELDPECSTTSASSRTTTRECWS